MQIAIDISPLNSGHSARGIGSYTKNLIQALKQYGTGNTFMEFSPAQGIPKEADVVHFPYFDPFFLTLPVGKPKPCVVTVHDLIPLVFPDKFPAGLRGNLKWQIQKMSLHGAKRIIADSNASKRDVIKIAGIRENIIDTVYLAPDPEFHPGVGSSISGKYLLYVGDVNWNKNVMGLLQAFAALRKQEKFEKYSLVLVGKAFLDTTLMETQNTNIYIKEHNLDASIIRTGPVSIKELCGLYSGASVYVQPSIYEGFGLPVLEAMACGCPVVCTNTSSLKEIAGPSVLVSPTAEDLFYGISKMVHVKRDQQIQKQYSWVKQFSWKKVAQETLASYERALS